MMAMTAMTRRTPRALLAALAAAGGFLGWLTPDAVAAPATAELHAGSAAGAADCPDAAALAHLVNDGLGRTALVPAGADAAEARPRVDVTFERPARGYTATVRIGGARGGTRRLSNAGPGCGALANAVGVLLTVVLDTDAEAPGGAASVGATAGVASASSAGARTGGGAGGMNADVGVGGGVAEGLVGGWTPTLGLAGTLAYRHAAARLGGLWLPSKSSDAGPGRIDVGLAVARLGLCATTGTDRSRVTLGLCAQQQIGWMRGRGFDFFTGPWSDDHLWLAAGAAVVASGAFERSFGWEVEAGAVRLLQRQRFAVNNFGTRYQSDPFAFMTTLSFMTRVW
jgi:hypothetical protein